VLFAVVSAAVFVRLGIWQLHRLGERRARNTVISDRLREAERDAGSLALTDTTGIRFRRVRVTGTPDYDHELILAARSHKGAPGVNLLTPVRLAGRDTAVLVNRGWVYSPDGATVDHARWRERDTSTVTGYIEVYAPDAGVTKVAREPRLVRRLSRGELAPRISYPLAPYYLVATGDSADGAHPARRELPALDEGPHRSYALQWFSFMAIALAGAGLVIARERRRQ